MPPGSSLYDLLFGHINGEPLDAHDNRPHECIGAQQNVQRILNTRAGCSSISRTTACRS